MLLVHLLYRTTEHLHKKVAESAYKQKQIKWENTMQKIDENTCIHYMCVLAQNSAITTLSHSKISFLKGSSPLEVIYVN
jgi:hypothetical protein